MSEARDAAAQMRAVAADIEDIVMRLGQGEPWNREDADVLWAGADSLVDWANRLEAEESGVEMKLFIDRYEADGLWYIFDEADSGQQAYGPFADYPAAVKKLAEVYAAEQ